MLEVLQALLGADDMDDGSLDRPERGASALVGAIHTERLRRQGCEARDAGMAAPAELVDPVAGWDGHVDAGSAVHFPGRALRVSLSRPRRSSAEEGQRWHRPAEDAPSDQR